MLAMMLPNVGYAEDDERRKQAGEHFKKGTELYAEGDYEGALTQFRLGEALFDQPVLKDHIAMCHWRLGNVEAAVTHAEAAASGWAKTDKSGYAANSEARLAAYRRIVKAQTTTTTPAEAALTEPITAPKRASTPAIAWVGGGVTAVGVGLLASWGVVEVLLGQKIQDYETAAATNDSTTWTSLRDEIESRQTLAQVLLFSGAGATALGATLLIIGLTSKKEANTTLRLAPNGVVFVSKF